MVFQYLSLEVDNVNVVWICNVPNSELSKSLDSKVVSGGWIEGALNPIRKRNGFNIIYIWANSNVNTVKKKIINNHVYYLLPKCNKKDKLMMYFNSIFDNLIIDLVHIWGTEYLHSAICLEICEQFNIKYVISIQGLIANCALAYNIKIPFSVIYKFSLVELIRRNTLTNQIKSFISNGITERELIKKAKYIIGRTNWDRENILSINKKIHYYHCNENLRSSFYQAKKWNINECEKNSIFVSQASYPLKGFHVLLYALSIVREDIPDITVYVAGYDIIKRNDIKSRILKSSYARYISKLIRSLNLENNIKFLGPLEEKEMIVYYLKTNIFCNCSLMENSSNSLSEAMILGVPVISSYVGGIPSLAENDSNTFFYCAYDYLHLAALIKKLLLDTDVQNQMSKNNILRAELRHNIDSNTDKLLSIYKEILFGRSIK